MRYKLPKELGEGEYEAMFDSGVSASTALNVNGRKVIVPTDMLTPVKPPLPEEPPVGTVARALLTDEDEPWVFERLGKRTDGKDWGAAGRDEVYAWADLNVRATPVVMVPDPFAEPVELPWELDVSDGPRRNRTVRVNYFPHAPATPVLSLEGNDVKVLAEVSPDQARAIANALMTAADAAQKEQQS